MTSDSAPRVRREPLPDDAVLVVRGDILDPDLLTVDARRFARRFPGWGRTGVSGYYARGEDEVTALCQTRLVNFATVVVFTRADLERHGIDAVATFRTPHVTLVAADSQTLVQALIECPHLERPNPYHGKQPD